MTLVDLETSIKAWAENYDDSFIAQLPTLIQQAENRIATAVRLPSFSKVTQISVSALNPITSTPADFLAADSVAIIGRRPMLKKDPEFLDEAFQGIVGEPRFYATQDAQTILWGPVPDADYYATLRYFCMPESLVDSTDGTYISDTYAAALFSACLWMASLFMKDWDGVQIHKQQFTEALGQAADVTYGPWDKSNFEKNNSAVDGKQELGKRG